jgi:hypothetical protein
MGMSANRDRELRSTLMRLAHRLNISYDEADALVRGVRTAVAKLCPLLAAWVLQRVARQRFGGTAAVAAALAAYISRRGRPMVQR